MARQALPKGINNFSGGLITEATALRFPPNACTETFDCVFDETGRISRRRGFDLEPNSIEAVHISGSVDENVFTEYRWESVANDGTRTFIAQQRGNFLQFYNISDGVTLIGNKLNSLLDLNDYVPSGSAKNAKHYECQYASGRGSLLVVSGAINPIIVQYSPATNSFTTTEIELKVRDFKGLDDSLDLTERVTSTVADLKTNNPEHYYNLLNQGWFIADALDQWDTARSDLPSNADYVALYRNSATDAFDNSRVTANTPGNRPASKGHFILSAWDPDRTQAMTDEGFTGATIVSENEEIDEAVGTTFDVGFSNESRCFDGTTNANLANSATTLVNFAYVGKNYSSPFAISQAIVHGSNDQGFVSGSNTATELILTAKQGAAPTHVADGTNLGTASFTDTSNESAGRTITSSDTTTEWDYVWVALSNTNISALNVGAITEVRLFRGRAQDQEQATFERPRCVEFFAGRAWYAGLDSPATGGEIYFTQIIETDDQFGKCYQKNDPASEDLTDLLADDGGVIRIPEIGKVIRLFAYQTSLLVYATNGVWLISGSSGASFLATDYQVRRISNEGTNSPLSFLSYKGVPSWWGTDGIFTVQFDPNYNSFQVVSLSDNKIKTFISDIPEYNRRFVKGAFDANDGTGYWLYNDGELTVGDEYRYNRVLVVNGLNGAFYPWTISETGPAVRGIVYAVDPLNTETPTIKYTTTIDINGSTEYHTYSHVYQDAYLDWALAAEDLVDEDVASDYSSYFITGYAVDGDAMRYFQSNYIWVYLEHAPNASCYMQGLFDFTNSGDSGKWSTRQQLFNGFLEHRDVNHRRLKVRGKGKALQLKFTSEEGMPFTIIGWALWESANSAI